MFTLLCAISIQILKFFCKDRRLLLYMSRTLHLFGTDWCAMMVPIQVIRWYRMQCYDGTDSCAIVVPIRRYCQEGEFASEFAAEKLAYFLQKFGAEDSLKLHFRQYYYGPYSGKVRFVLHYLNGSFLKGVGQMEQKPFDPIWLSPDTFKDVQKFLANEENKPYEDICKKTASFLSGYYSNYLLELLSTVDYILHNNEDLKEWLIMKPQEVYELVVLHINQWSERKKYLFNNEEYVRLVLNHLYKFEKQNNGLLYV